MHKIGESMQWQAVSSKKLVKRSKIMVNLALANIDRQTAAKV